jgi:CheY-like chemotaxis protein
MEDKIILLVEDNVDDEKLTLRALKKNNISNEVVVARDGAEALDYLFGTGMHSGRDTSLMPQVVLLDLNLPKIDGLEVLRRLRENERTKLLPVLILTSSNKSMTVSTGIASARTVMYANPSTSINSWRPCANWDCIGWFLTNSPRPGDDRWGPRFAC